MHKSIFYIVGTIGFLLVYIKYIEKKSIFFPTAELEVTPSRLGIPFEDDYIKTTDGISIHGWYIPKKNAKYTVLFFHGNAGNISHRIEKVKIFHDIGVNTLFLDYRGYGRSQGYPSEQGIYKDAGAAFRHLVAERKMSPEQIVLYGESVGGAVAVDLASRTECGAVILESTFSRGRDMAKRIYPFLPSFLFSNLFDSLPKIKKVYAPKLFLHSKNDEIVPYSLARKLYDAAPQPKYFVELIGGHNTAFFDSGEKYITSIRAFIEGLDKKSSE